MAARCAAAAGRVRVHRAGVVDLAVAALQAFILAAHHSAPRVIGLVAGQVHLHLRVSVAARLKPEYIELVLCRKRQRGVTA